jgi:F5/8 type C domain
VRAVHLGIAVAMAAIAVAPVAKAAPKMVPNAAAAGTTWQNLGQKAGEPVTGYNANGLLEVFALDSGTLWHRSQKANGTFGGWASLGNPPLPDGQLAVANEADGRLAVFFRSPNGTVAAIRQKTPNGSWGAWSAPLATGGDVIGLAVAKDGDGRLHVLSMGTYDTPAVIDVAQTAPNGGWAAPVPLPAAGLVDHLSTGCVHAVANPDGRIELFCSGVSFQNGTFVSRSLHATFSSGTGWSAWSALPEAASHAVTGSLVRAADGRLMTFDSDGSRITVSAQQSAYGPWSVPERIATQPATDGRPLTPAAVAGADGHLELFAVVETKESAQLAQTLTELWYTRQVSPGGAWAPWVNAGYVGKAGQEDFRFSRESVTLDPSGRLNLVLRGRRGVWFLQQASPGGAWNFNPVLPAPKAITSLAGVNTFDLPTLMVDLNPDTVFHAQPAQSGDYVGVDLGIRRPIKTVEFVLGQDGPVQQGVVEYSGDGTGWTPLATVSGSPHVTVALPSGVAVQYVRLRATASQAQPVSVHEIKTA